MKKFETYQYLEGELMTERDKQEVGSKFWNEGKWNNFIKPHLSHIEKDIFIDIGCNAGLFLKLAKEYGFNEVIGVEPNKVAYNKAIKFGHKVINKEIENCLEELPVADVTLLANAHYYIKNEDWLIYLDRLKEKTKYCIIVTVKKKPNEKYAPSDVDGIQKDFKDWNQISATHIPKDDTPHSRELHTLCFQNPLLDRVDINSLDNGNNQQRNFLDELDKGIDPFKTNYYRRLKSYRRHNGSKQEMWSKERLTEYMNERVELYKNVKENGLIDPILVGDENRIKDGNHRHEIIRHLGYKSILIKKT